MTLYFIGIGLNDEKDITLKGLEAVQKSKFVYLENYTSNLQCSIKQLETLYKKKIILADRNLVEKQAEQTILKNTKKDNVAFLVIGDSMCATTHLDLLLRAKELKIKTEIIHNASIVSAIGITGLEIYKFGKITSIPFDNKNIKAPYDVLIDNLDKGLHTLFLLDLKPDKNQFLTIKQAIDYLLDQGATEKTKLSKNEKGLENWQNFPKAIACARIGSQKPKIIYGELPKLKEIDFGTPPYCLIIPAKLHFMEEDALKQWKIL